MNPPGAGRVANPPPRPLMLFDGNCHFCRRWIERWQEKSGGKIDYASSQEAGSQFPELSGDDFARAVQLVEPDGTVTSGAEAVFRVLARGGRGGRWLHALYHRVPAFAATTETLYALISRNRSTASRVTRWFWGDDV